MSKRLMRIKPDKMHLIMSGTEINAVLQNGATYFGKIESVTKELLILLDTRQHRHSIAISNLYEIVYDIENVIT